MFPRHMATEVRAPDHADLDDVSAATAFILALGTGWMCLFLPGPLHAGEWRTSCASS